MERIYLINSKGYLNNRVPIEKPKIEYKNFIGAMKLDKKNKDKEIYLVLQQGIGKAIVTNKYLSNTLDEIIKS